MEKGKIERSGIYIHRYRGEEYVLEPYPVFDDHDDKDPNYVAPARKVSDLIALKNDYKRGENGEVYTDIYRDSDGNLLDLDDVDRYKITWANIDGLVDWSNPTDVSKI